MGLQILDDLSKIKSFGRGTENQPNRFGRDSRSLLIVFFTYMGFVVSVPKYSLVQLATFGFFPLFFLISTSMPLLPIAKKMLFVSPFIVFLGIFNPFLDPSPLFQLWGIPVSGGMVSFAVILVKGVFSVLAIVILTGIVPFYEICSGLAAMKVPQPFIVQLLFLYRYLFVLVDEADSMRKARDLRSFHGRGKGIAATAGLLGTLFLRTLDKSQRIYRSMVSKGFSGQVPPPEHSKFRLGDLGFILLFLTLFGILRWFLIL